MSEKKERLIRSTDLKLVSEDVYVYKDSPDSLPLEVISLPPDAIRATDLAPYAGECLVQEEKLSPGGKITFNIARFSRRTIYASAEVLRVLTVTFYPLTEGEGKGKTQVLGYPMAEVAFMLMVGSQMSIKNTSDKEVMFTLYLKP